MNKMAFSKTRIFEEIAVDVSGDASEAVEKLANLIAEKKAEGWEDLRLRVDFGDEWGSDGLMLEGNRPENEKEKTKRLKTEAATQARLQKVKEQTKERELKEYQRLKAKYEGNNG